MDTPPPLPLPTTSTATADSSASSPRTWDFDALPPKLRLMCSYGGQIIPRPHDKSLCYVGGDTRIVVADRRSSLSDLSSRLSRTLLNGRHFTLKYQLPNEELDSLVSVTTDEDLDNMIEEHDRLNDSSNPSSRLRLFLFLSKPETSASIGCLLNDAKSETWFIDALNGAGLLPRGMSDPAAVDNLLELEDNVNETIGTANVDSAAVQAADLQTVETTSSFGSSSSSLSMSNLPPIKVSIDHQGVQDQMAGLDEQLSNLSVAPPPLMLPIPAIIGGSVAAPGGSGMPVMEHVSRVVSDEERSDHGVAPPSRLRKPPLPLQPVQRKLDAYSLLSPDSKHGGYNLASPDSVASDSSISSATSLAKQTFYQDQNPVTNKEPEYLPAMQNSPDNIVEPRYEAPTHQVKDSSYPQQRQYFYAPTQHLHHPGTNQHPSISPYYPVYVPSLQQHIDQQYPLYFMPLPQNKSNAADATNPSATIYPSKTGSPLNIPDVRTGTVYKTASPAILQYPPNQFQHQYLDISHISHRPPLHPTANYGFEYGQQTQDPIYYSQHQVPPSPSQYQTMTAATTLLLSQASNQQPVPKNSE